MIRSVSLCNMQMIEGFVKASLLCKQYCQIDASLRVGWIALQRLVISLLGKRVLALAIICPAEIVARFDVRRRNLQRLKQRLLCFVQLILVYVSHSEVVISIGRSEE